MLPVTALSHSFIAISEPAYTIYQQAAVARLITEIGVFAVLGVLKQ